MTKSSRIRLTLFAALLATAAACRPDDQGLAYGTQASAQVIASHTDTGTGLMYEVGTRAPFTEACPDDRMIGTHTTGAACPLPHPAIGGTWHVRALFGDGLPGLPPDPLAKYCVYQWNSPSGKVPDPLALPHDGIRPPRVWLSQDCNVVAGQGYEQRVNPVLQASFLNQVNPTLAAGNGATAQVWIVDSAVDTGFGSVGSGRLEHGRALELAVSQMTCGGGGCDVAVASSLALKLGWNAVGELARDDTNGGYFGSLGDLAEAIYEAVYRAGQVGPRLVINLSVGWDPEHGGDFAGTAWSTLPPPHRAVYQALMLARCRGAVIIAAAGNASGGSPAGTGPIFPARWEEKGIPTPAECFNLGVTNLPGATSTYRPLLYAASGVDGADATLGNARPQSQARLVAPGAFAVFANPSSPDGYTSAYTGSSVAAAVTSAAVALAWAQLPPTYSGTDVVELVRSAAPPLGRPADFCSGLPCGPQRRVSLCAAYAAACGAAGGCPGNLGCNIRPAFSDERPVVLAPDQGEVDKVFSAGNLTRVRAVGFPCNADLVTSLKRQQVQPCPARQLYGHEAEPWVDPQPEKPICPSCAATQRQLFLMLANPLPGAIREPSVLVVDAAGTETYYALEIPETELQAGAVIKVTDFPVDFGTTEKAYIEFLVKDASGDVYSTSDPLLLEN